MTFYTKFIFKDKSLITDKIRFTASSVIKYLLNIIKESNLKNNFYMLNVPSSCTGFMLGSSFKFDN